MSLVSKEFVMLRNKINIRIVFKKKYKLKNKINEQEIKVLFISSVKSMTHIVIPNMKIFIIKKKTWHIKV